MHSQTKLLLVAFVTGALGYLAGGVTGALGYLARGMTAAPSKDAEVLRALESQRAQLEALTAQVAALGPGRCASGAALDPTALREEIGRILREALAARSGPAARDASAREEPKRAEPTAAHLAAVERASRLIEGSVQSRQWGDAQAQEFRTLLIDMNDEQRTEMMRKLAATLNRGDIQVTTQGPPF